jgi:hypothetical protein
MQQSEQRHKAAEHHEEGTGSAKIMGFRQRFEFNLLGITLALKCQI